jgi:hypothetical protein
MLRVRDFLKPLMERMDLYQPCRDRMALILWPEIVGPYVGRNTAAVGIKSGILFVRTASAAWMTELRIGFRQQYIAALNRRLGEEVVKDIRFLPPPLPEAERDPAREDESLSLRPLGPDDEKMIDEVVATLEVPELRHRLRRVMRRDRALRRARLEAGWRPCPACGTVLTRDGGSCATCMERARRNRIFGIRRQLLRAPWVSPLDVKARFPDMTLQEYQRVKGYLLHSLKKGLEAWHLRAPEGARFSDEALGRALRYCMLRFGKRPHELSQRDIKFALGRLAVRYPD